MIHEITYNGYSAAPSDYECIDGDLATSIGMIQENGAMHPVLPPSDVLQLYRKGVVIKYIHKTSNFKHYIVLDKRDGFEEQQLLWLDSEDPSIPKWLNEFTSEIYKVDGIGNTLVVLASDGMHYFLWKGAEIGYLYLGTEIPECPLSFGLQGELVKSKQFEVTFGNSVSEEDIWKDFSDKNKKTITEQVLAQVNKFIAEKSTSAGKFIYPFLLRYAYRLYDGSLTKHSAPILMIASSDLAPQVFVWNIEGKSEYDRAEMSVVAVCHKIDFAAISESALEKIKEWSDIVKSIDIFVSKPIYTYNQNGECTGFDVFDEEDDAYCVCKHINQHSYYDEYPLRYQFQRFSKLFIFTYPTIEMLGPVGRLKLPKRSVDEVKSDIKDCAQFYFLESVKIEQLSMSRTLITVEEEYLQSLVAREVMTDDYDSHDKIIPRYSFPYNNRLNVANLKKVLFGGYHTGSIFMYSDGYVSKMNGQPSTILDYTVAVDVFIYIKQDGRDIIIKGERSVFSPKVPILFLYYPNPNAYKAIIMRESYPTSYYEVPLEKHNFLNGAFYYGGWEDLKVTTTIVPEVSDELSRTIDVPNKIYTSEINNPFYFPLLGINTIGNGEILGLSSAAKALSEGQFGQFPLYAFTSEGVWALEVSPTGTYSAKQPISRDVVINTDSITQIDSAVLFATNRGIMLISGSNLMCVSDVLNSTNPFSIEDLPKSEKLLEVFNSKAEENEQTLIQEVSMLPFLDYLQGCKMIYDYKNQHIIVYNPEVRYAYVYSLKSKAWGMILSDIIDNVNSYPDALAMANGGKLVDFSNPIEEKVTGLIVTRPFKINAPNGFKTIHSIIQRGMFKSDHVKQILYGSNDLEHWYIIWSSVDKIMRGFRGTPFKAYRLAIVCKFDKNESLYGCSVEYEQRLTNQLR